MFVPPYLERFSEGMCPLTILAHSATSFIVLKAFQSASLSNIQKSALLIGPIYFLHFLASAIASRYAVSIVKVAGSENNAADILWLTASLIFGIFGFAAFYNLPFFMTLALMTLQILQNFWRPILISRIDEHSQEIHKATVLSIESQARRGSTMILAPLLGLMIDFTRNQEIGGSEFWPIGVIGTLIALIFLFSSPTMAGPK